MAAIQDILKVKLSTTTGSLYLKDIQKNFLVIYFYPKDDTPGCTQEGKDFSHLYKEFQALNTEIFGVSRDSLNSHEKFKNKYGYPFTLISDMEENLCKAFQVLKEKNMYGKKVFGIERSTFVLDKKTKKILHEWRKVKVQNHAEEVLKFIKSL